MDDIVKIYIILIVVFLVVMFVILGVIAYFRKKRLEEIVEKLGLIEGNTYDVIVNNGSKQLNLVYTHIAYGNKSQNGNINIYFEKTTKYRGSPIVKQVMIKYENIWKIYNISNQTETTVQDEILN